MKFNAYVDGFNLYRGLLKDRPESRWLDLREFCASRWSEKSLEKVYFFTARAKERYPGDDAPRRQHAYLRALESTGVEIVLGKFAKNVDWLRINGTQHADFIEPNLEDTDSLVQLRFEDAANNAAPDFVKANVWRFGEKGTDVNLASQLVFDAWKANLSNAMVVTGDSDLQTPIRMLVDSGIQVKTLIPSLANFSTDLRNVSTYTESIHLSWLKTAQLPERVPTRTGFITRPQKWR
jgi:uncharacterized LabA/DUF88 family protein